MYFNSMKPFIYVATLIIVISVVLYNSNTDDTVYDTSDCSKFKFSLEPIKDQTVDFNLIFSSFIYKLDSDAELRVYSQSFAMFSKRGYFELYIDSSEGIDDEEFQSIKDNIEQYALREKLNLDWGLIEKATSNKQPEKRGQAYN